MNGTRYHPVVRWKDSEKRALLKLDPEDAAGITPIIELVPRDFVGMPSERVIECFMKELAMHWRRPAFLDFGLLSSEIPTHFRRDARKQSNYYSNNVGIVTQLDSAYNSEVRQYFGDKPLCLRIKMQDMLCAKLCQAITLFLKMSFKIR